MKKYNYKKDFAGKRFKIGDKIEISGNQYLLVGLNKDGKIHEYGLVYLTDFTIGTTMSTIHELLELYNFTT